MPDPKATSAQVSGERDHGAKPGSTPPAAQAAAPAQLKPIETPGPPGVTTRAVFTGLFLVLLFAYAAPTWVLRYRAFASWGGYLPYEAVVALILLVAVNRWRAHFALLGALAMLTAVMPAVLAFASWKEFSNAPFVPDLFEDLAKAGRIPILPWGALFLTVAAAAGLAMLGRVLLPERANAGAGAGSLPGGPGLPGAPGEADASGAHAAPGTVLAVVLFLAALLCVTRGMYAEGTILHRDLRSSGGAHLVITITTGGLLALALFLTGAVAAVRSVRLARRELMAIFIILMLGGLAIRTTGWLVGNLPKPYNMANNQNDFKEKFLKAVKPEFVPYHLVFKELDKLPREERERVARFGVETLDKLPEEEQERLRKFEESERKAMGRFYSGLDRVHRRPELGPEEMKAHRGKVRTRRASIREVIRTRWVGPLARWMVLIGLVYLVQFCLAGLLRRQWVENEKLMFPHTEVPLSLVEDAEPGTRRGLFSKPAFWVGAGMTAFLFLLNGLNLHQPAVPKIELANIRLTQFLSSRIFNGMDRRLNIQPFVIGISYLLSAEISFSVWFFALLNNLFHMAGPMFNLNQHDRFALCGEWLNSGEMILGATIVFVGSLFWASRRHLAQVARGAWARGLGLALPVSAAVGTAGLLMRWAGGAGAGLGTALLVAGGLVAAGSFVLGLAVTSAENRDEPIPYFFSFWGFILGALGVLLWCRWAGMAVWASAAIFFFYLVLILIVARAVCECGMVTAGFDFMPWRPYLAFASVFGHKVELTWLGRVLGLKAGAMLPTMAMNSFIWPSIMRNMQALPFAMTALQLTDRTGRRRGRWLLAAAAAGIALFMVVFAHGMLSVCYDQGLQNLGQDWYTDMSPFNNHFLRDLLDKERTYTPDAWNLKCMLGGGIVMVFLIAMRRLFYWWPLHPIGFVIPGVEWGIWFSVLIGWFVKRTALKYGGGKFAQRLVPFFLGLVVGQFAMQALWALIGFVGGQLLQAPVLHVQRVAG